MGKSTKALGLGLLLFSMGILSRAQDKIISERELPAEITSYLKANFPGADITDRELDDRKQKVGLGNGMDQEFYRKGDFLRIDD